MRALVMLWKKRRPEMTMTWCTNSQQLQWLVNSNICYFKSLQGLWDLKELLNSRVQIYYRSRIPISKGHTTVHLISHLVPLFLRALLLVQIVHECSNNQHWRNHPSWKFSMYFKWHVLSINYIWLCSFLLGSVSVM